MQIDFGNRGNAMEGLRYVLMGMGCMALLVVGSCSLLSYSAVKVAETTEEAIETMDDNTADAIAGLEQAAELERERKREEELFGRNSRNEEYPADEYE
jgi:threonine dehydrogenase-like Zn-dependent dehydrogenase